MQAVWSDVKQIADAEIALFRFVVELQTGTAFQQ